MMVNRFAKPQKVILMTARITAMAVVCAAFAAAQQSDRGMLQTASSVSKVEQSPGLAGNVCPPFFLRDEAGNVINPVAGENADQPYSPKQTCGACHDYEKITQGFHFQQGADEQRPGVLGERCQWVSSPGNYGGAWCSPAPLYSYLSPKHNDDSHLIDMTSFVFITRGCGKCHPGGGPLEYDRDGKRYDRWMGWVCDGRAAPRRRQRRVHGAADRALRSSGALRVYDIRPVSGAVAPGECGDLRASTRRRGESP